MAPASIEQALALAGVTPTTLAPGDAAALDVEGYVILRGVLAPETLADLRDRFEASYLPRDQWPAPREHGTRHAMLDADEAVRRVCLSPPLLAAVFHMLGKRFYLSDVQGRDPLPGHGYQGLHRDWPDDGKGPSMVVGLAFLEPFGEANGATRLVPRTHLEAGEMGDYAGHGERHPRQVVVEGAGGDVLLFHGRLVHSGMRNLSGAPRRSLQICYRSHATYETHRETRDLARAPALDRYLMGAP
ncbi:MAG TPA: phytanoyl-CoA dioxygenase family protein [Rhizomicrobium sp.]|jgi:ectoine hydroxylase-related dioxygenase (phytanoyl-CoA dioxygenase family)|nr:phytanoyl-CoA dioxygenase family protein [Rhizomicrobium sp.]